MVLAWQQLGFVAGGDGFTFCRVEDEDTVTLPLYEGAEDESEDEVSNEMQDFIVNDADGEAFIRRSGAIGRGRTSIRVGYPLVVHGLSDGRLQRTVTRRSKHGWRPALLVSLPA